METTLSKIDTIIGRINTHLEYSVCVNREESHSLREEAEGHSLDLELLNEGIKVSKRERAVLLSRLNQAEKFLAKEDISLYSLSRLGSLIEPEGNPTGGFRNELVKFGSFYSEEPAKVPYRVQSLTHFLKDSLIHPVLKASNLHLDFVQIHPYMDGNGRVARLIQNFCLQQRGYPPAIILAGERKTYLILLDKVLKDRYGDKSTVFDQSKSEKDFHEFIALKVLDSSRTLENELRKSRMYTLNLSQLRDPQVARIVANHFKGLSRLRNGGGIAVLINKSNGCKKGETLRIRGDIGYDKLTQVLEKDSLKYGFRYKLDTDPCSCVG